MKKIYAVEELYFFFLEETLHENWKKVNKASYSYWTDGTKPNCIGFAHTNKSSTQHHHDLISISSQEGPPPDPAALCHQRTTEGHPSLLMEDNSHVHAQLPSPQQTNAGDSTAVARLPTAHFMLPITRRFLYANRNKM